MNVRYYLNYCDCIFQGEFTVKLEISNVSQHDKGSYKLMAKNEKGEATSQQVEITDIPEEKGDKPQIVKHLRSLVRNSLIYYIFE